MMKKPMTLVEEISELDIELLKLLARRHKLVQKTRRPKKEGSGTAGIANEKQIRLLWEANAVKFSKDPRLAHQLFSLIQDIEFSSKAEADERTEFTLSPNRKPVNVDLPGPASLRSSRLWLALIAAAGAPCRLRNVPTADPVHDFLKALEQTGASLHWQRDDIVSNGSGPLAFGDKTLFAGDDELNVYLLGLMAAGRHGTLKMTGGSALKDADLTAFRHFLPQLGARIGHVMPRSNGLPVRLECSGVLPDTITIPADLPGDAVCACLVSAATWERPTTFVLSGTPHAEECLAVVRNIFTQCGVTHDGAADAFSVTPGTFAIPAVPVMAMDPAISATLLALPVFTGGTVRLAGTWPTYTAEGSATLELLRSSGLDVTVGADAIVSRAGNEAERAAAAGTPPSMEGLSSRYLPLAIAICCARAKSSGVAVPLPVVLDRAENDLLDGFVAQAGMALNKGAVAVVADAPAARIWTSPDAYWTMAFALLAFLKRSIRLANPSSVTDLMPLFWTVYNGLPEPSLTRKPKQESTDEQPKRRRIIAG